MASTAEWALGYARQAEVDLQTFNLLSRQQVPQCHRLQFLQMACEKLCKAHLCSGGASPESLKGSHAYVAGTLPVVLTNTFALLQPNAAKGIGLRNQIKYIAKEIEVLAPAVKRAGSIDREDNCEYPWSDAAGKLHVPRDWVFQPAQLLETEHGRNFMKLLQIALSRLLV